MLLDVLSSPWVIMPEKLQLITDICARHLRKEKADISAIEAQLGRQLKTEPQSYVVDNGVAVISARGPMARHMNFLTEISGGVSTDLLAKEIRRAESDASVHSKVFLVDSPGGSVDGVEQLADIVRDSSINGKPAVTLAEGKIGSGAIWAFTGPPRVFLSSNTDVAGSIGVVAQHVDRSRMEENAGIKITEITAGKYKRIASEHAPLTAEGRATMQDQLDHIYSVFVDAVARNRKTTSADVLDRMADGRVFLGKQAVSAGIVDGFSNLQALVGMLNNERAAKAKSFLGGLR